MRPGSYIPGSEVRFRGPRSRIPLEYTESRKNRQHNQAHRAEGENKDKEVVERATVCFACNAFIMCHV